MPDLFAPESWNERPAMRVLVLAWAAAAAQTPIATWAWLSCFALGLAAARWPVRADMDNTPLPSALHELAPAVPAAPTRPQRRTARRQNPSVPLLTAHHDLAADVLSADQLGEAADAWARAVQQQGQSICVLHLALTGLPELAARYGDGGAQQLDLQVTKRLRHLARTHDLLVRLDKEHFLVMAASPAGEAGTLAQQLAVRIVREVQRPLAYRTLSNLHLGCNIGSTVWAPGVEGLPEALRQAEQALQLATSSGRGQMRQYAAIRETLTA